MRILFDKNVPVGVRAFLAQHQVLTMSELGWPDQLDNGELLDKAEQSGFDLLITSDQNIRYQQRLTGRSIALLILGSNIWPIVRTYATAIRVGAETAKPGTHLFIEMPLPS